MLRFSLHLSPTAALTVAAFLGWGWALAQPQHEIILIREGQALATIVVGPEPSQQASEAAAELQAYLRRMSGVELPIAAKPDSAQAVAILVGRSAAKEAAEEIGLSLPTGLSPQFDDEGYVVAAGDGVVILAGNETDPYQGTFYAVYDLLESLGCRWYFPGEFGEVVPSLRTIAVPVGRKLVRPQFRIRDTWYSGHLSVSGQQHVEYQTWKRRNRMTRAGVWAFGSPWLENPVDDSTYRLLPKDKYWDTHPEYFALLPGGGRHERFLCMSNPGALQAAADTVVEYFQQHPDHLAFAFSPPDEPVLCHCPDCTESMHGGYGGEGYGEVSDAYFRFVFALADIIRERCPGKWITTMAYYNRCRPPEGVEGKRDNLLIQLASIQQCNLHCYADETCWSRQEFRSMLRRWAELTAGQVYYEYDPHDWSHAQRPHWRSQGIAEDHRLLRSLGGWGYSNEGQMAWLSTGLNWYLRAHLAWDLELDPAEEIRDFCTRFFGPAARPMLRYYTEVEQAIRTATVHGFGFSDQAAAVEMVDLLFPRPLLDEWLALLDEAKALATEEPYARRVAAFRAGLDRLDNWSRARTAMVRGDYQGAVGFGEAMTKVVTDLGDSALMQDAGPWGGAASGAGVKTFAQATVPWVDGTKGKLFTALPTEALFCTDAASEGVVHRWYLPDANPGWRPIRLDRAWHHQGVVNSANRPYRGVAWYRVRLLLPANVPSALRLVFPDLRASEAWVWCGGHFAGYVNKQAGEVPNVRISGLLRPGENLLVIRVQGSGGICLPPLLCEPSAELAAWDSRTELAVLPSQWLLRPDPEDKGEQLGWHQPDVDPTGWQPVPVPARWEDTFLGSYDGVAWYRVKFTIPESAEGQKLVLHFGAVDEEAWVYLNGELVGEHTETSTGRSVHQIWDEPFDIELSNARCGGENTLAVKVRDSMLAGGIYQPVRLYLIPVLSR